MALNTRSELEEERRLFYVAITRAEKKATLSFATSRYRWGQLVHCEMSRFIEEIDSKFLDMERVFSRNEEKNELPFGMPPNSMPGFSAKKGTKASKTKKAIPTITTSSTYNKKNLKRIESIENKEGLEVDVKRIVVGAKVSHERFGKGKVINIEGTPPNVKATVFFPEKGQKQLLLKYAKLNVIG
jgi:DNA helicase-2/ATP-dependent DNA helicase PcrA